LPGDVFGMAGHTRLEGFENPDDLECRGVVVCRLRIWGVARKVFVAHAYCLINPGTDRFSRFLGSPAGRFPCLGADALYAPELAARHRFVRPFRSGVYAFGG